MEEQTSKGTERVPYDLGIESTVLGQLILETDHVLYELVRLRLRPSFFYDERHGIIYSVILKLFDKGEVVDYITIVNQLRKDGCLEEVGGPGYVASLTDHVASTLHLEDHAKILVEYAMRRHMSSLGSMVEKDSADFTADIFELMDAVVGDIFSLQTNLNRVEPVTAEALLREYIPLLEAKQAKQGMTGVPSGFFSLDKIMSGWQPGELSVLAARPGMGKTSLLLHFLIYAIKSRQEKGGDVLFFSLEMSRQQVVDRLLAQYTGIAASGFRDGKLSEDDWKELHSACAQLIDLDFHVDDTPNTSLIEMRAKCRRLKHNKGLQLVCVDYLQLISSNMRNRTHFHNREQEVSYICRGLKIMAKELQVPVIVASQLSRAVEVRGGEKIPQLSDLRDSGAIEQDADNVLFLYRPSYYAIGDSSTEKDTDLILAKHRNGANGKFRILFDKETTSFSD